MGKLLPANKALEIVLKNVRFLKAGKVYLDEALGRILSENIYTAENLPPFVNSAMDGYAVKARDTKSVTPGKPVVLKLLEDLPRTFRQNDTADAEKSSGYSSLTQRKVRGLPAGYLPTKKIKTGETIKIMTGAILPEGADAVVKVEDTETQASGNRQQVKVFKEVKENENIRQIGEDVKKGELVLKKGKLIRAQEIALFAALGMERVKVYPKPRVAILTTGDELVEVGEELNPGKIRDSNSYMLSAEVINAGGIPLRYGIIPDKKEILKNKLKKAIQSVDLLLTSAGVSVGEYDLVEKCLLELGFKLKFHTLAIRPGKPLLFGLLRDKPVFGLPGNPVSAMVTFKIFVRPALLRMQGITDYSLPKSEAVIEEKIVKKQGLRYYLRGKLKRINGQFYVRTTGPQGSGIISSLTKADCLVVVPEEKKIVEKGEKVEVLFLD